MGIFTSEHAKQPLLLIAFKSAGVNPFTRIFISAKQHIPPSSVAIVVLMSIELVMYAVHCRALRCKSDPARCSYTGVIKNSPTAVHKV